jgi:hypothetical protein
MQEIYKNPIGYYKICNYKDVSSVNENGMKNIGRKIFFPTADRSEDDD